MAERYPWLADVGANSLVLTSNRRLAGELHRVHTELMLTGSGTAWRTPHIHFWRDWCRRIALTANGGNAPRPLGASTSRIVWEQCLRDKLGDDALATWGLAGLARTTWQRVADWCLTPEALAASALNRDQRLYAETAERYCERLDQESWMDEHNLVDGALQCLSEADLPQTVWLVGFVRMPPIVRRVCTALEQAGSAVQPVALGDTANRVDEQAFPDRATELRSAGAWARECLSSEPETRLAIASPDLHAHAATYRRLVMEGYAPGWQLGGERHRHAINVTYGERFSDYPSIDAALSVLRLTIRGLSSRAASQLLRSPHLGVSDRSLGVAIDTKLRGTPERTWSAAALADAVGRWCGTDAAHGLQAIAACAARGSERRWPRDWARTLQTLLEALEWPGHPLDSTGFQVLNRWRELLNQVADADVVLGRQRLAAVVEVLTRFARDTLYQPELPHERVQLMGVLEALGHRFDRLWIAGMESSRWPPAGRPLVLVAGALQRARGMPDATPGDTLQYGRAVVQQLLAAAPRVRFSWARHVGEQRQGPSPALVELGLPSAHPVPECGWYAASLLGAASTLEVEPDTPPPVAGEERLLGGVATLNHQFAEPFAAFAIGRLGAAPLDAFQSGLPARLRGVLLHQSLYHLLSDVPDQRAMANWSEAEKQRRVAAATERAFALELQHADPVLTRLLELERHRQRGVLGAFLERELSRPPFDIQSLEQPLEYSCAGLRLRVRADRIDRLPDGRRVLLDYKSGTPMPFVTVDGDPHDYQLVLYAAAQQQRTAGLVAAYLQRTGIEYRGAGADFLDKERPSKSWQTTLERWMNDLHAACGEIAAGDVRLRSAAGGSTPRELDVLSRRAEIRGP